MSDYLSIAVLREHVVRYLAAEAERFTVGDPAADPPAGDMTQATLDAFIGDALRAAARLTGAYSDEAALDGATVPVRLQDAAARYAAGLVLARLGLGETDSAGRTRLVREALAELAADRADGGGALRTGGGAGQAFPAGSVRDFSDDHNPYDEE